MPPKPQKRGNESGTAKMDFELNGPPQPQMVGFCDLVGVGIASVSKKLLLIIFSMNQFHNIAQGVLEL